MNACEIAENHFNNADPEFIDAAILELRAAELRRDQELKELRERHGIFSKDVHTVSSEDHIRKLRSYLRSGFLSESGKEFVRNEIIEIREEMKSSAYLPPRI